MRSDGEERPLVGFFHISLPEPNITCGRVGLRAMNCADARGGRQRAAQDSTRSAAQVAGSGGRAKSALEPPPEYVISARPSWPPRCVHPSIKANRYATQGARRRERRGSRRVRRDMCVNRDRGKAGARNRECNNGSSKSVRPGAYQCDSGAAGVFLAAY